MLWSSPLALLTLFAVTAPLLIHLLVQRHAERLPFPTLRFLRPTRLTAMRRHLLEDLPLLAVRAAVIAAAAAALAGPSIVTSARREAWNRRIVRAIVVDSSSNRADSRPPRTEEQPFLEQTFGGSSLADGLRRATIWLQSAPPARREIVFVSTLAIGSITEGDLASIPAGTGVRFERTGALPPTRTVPGGRLLTPASALARQVMLTGAQTSVREVADNAPAAWPIEVVAETVDRTAVDAAVAAVRSQRVWGGPPDRRAQLLLVKPRRSESATAFPMQRPWMAAAAVRIAADHDVRAAGVRVAAGLTDPQFQTAPWQTLAAAADGRPVAAAAASPDRLLVASAAPAADVATPVLLRAIANAIADIPDLRGVEVLPIADDVLRRWSRPPSAAPAPRLETIDGDDRRWLWMAVLALLVLEQWIRRDRPASVDQPDRDEQARVA